MNPEQAKTILSFVADCIERESAATARVLAAVPAEQGDYKPHEKCMPALKLAWHIAAAEQMFNTGVAAGTFEGSDNGPMPETVKGGADVAAWYQEQTAKNVAALKAMTPEQCAAKISFHEKWVMPAFAWAQLSLTHAIHHRGQLSAYLRPMGSKVPSIYGPSGDDEVTAAGA